MNPRSDVIVVGAGVVGLASALALLERGRSVHVVDAGRIGGGSSHGNCGTLTPSHAGPLYAPGMILKAMGWMLTPDAPFYVKPSADPALWQWMAQFARRCNARDWRRAAQARAAILNASRQAFPEWMQRYGMDCRFSEGGADTVFRDPRELDAYVAQLPALAELGVASEVIEAAEYHRQEPALREGIVGAVRYPGDAHLRPDRYVAELARAVRERGGTIEEHNEARALTEQGDGIRVSTANGPRDARDVLLAAGAWSPLLAKALGVRWLRSAIQPGKGYSITYTRPGLAPKRPLTLHERRVCVTVWEDGYRLGSTMEFSGYDDSLNRRRLDALERGAAEYLHEPVGPVKQEEWYGWRPLSWDDTPIIGRAPGRQRLWLATGHGMLGVSMSPATGQLVAELLTGDAPHIDPAPYAPSRFA
jgi:D-amino-acid dehydrogenase